MTDRGLPASAYAVPSARLLPLTDETGTPNARQIAAAVGKLKTLPPEHQGTATNRTIAAWRKLHPGKPDGAMPAGLRKAALTPGTISDQTGLFAGLSDVNDDGTVSAMIAFGLPAQIGAALAIDPTTVGDGVQVTPLDMLHCKVADIDVLPGDLQASMQIIAACARAAWQTAPFDAEITGVGVLLPDVDDEDDLDDDPNTADGIAIVLLDSPGLNATCDGLLDAVRGALEDAGIGYEIDHGYVPHISLARGPIEQLPVGVVDAAEWTVDMLAVVVGSSVQHFPLLGGVGQNPDSETAAPMMMVAKDAAKRYTFAPLYVPGVADTHGEYATADQLERAAWDYVQRGEFEINLQHIPGTKAGTCVACAPLPWPVTCTLTTGQGVTKSVELPAGTVYMGVVWEPVAWDMVLKDEINGLSLEGTAYRREPGAAAA